MSSDTPTTKRSNRLNRPRSSLCIHRGLRRIWNAKRRKEENACDNSPPPKQRRLAEMTECNNYPSCDQNNLRLLIAIKRELQIVSENITTIERLLIG